MTLPAILTPRLTGNTGKRLWLSSRVYDDNFMILVESCRLLHLHVDSTCAYNNHRAIFDHGKFRQTRSYIHEMHAVYIWPIHQVGSSCSFHFISRHRALCTARSYNIPVRPSVRPLHCVIAHIVKLFHLLATILIFWAQLALQLINSNDKTLKGGINIRLGNMPHFFDRNRRLFRKQYQIGPWLLWIINRKS